jgi:hypothetical protein
MGRLRGIEREMEMGAFALVDKEDALSKAKQDSSKSLIFDIRVLVLVERKEYYKERTEVAANINHEAEQLCSR